MTNQHAQMIPRGVAMKQAPKTPFSRAKDLSFDYFPYFLLIILLILCHYSQIMIKFMNPECLFTQNKYILTHYDIIMTSTNTQFIKLCIIQEVMTIITICDNFNMECINGIINMILMKKGQKHSDTRNGIPQANSPKIWKIWKIWKIS